MDPSETQTQIVLRDLMDNGSWGWVETAPDDPVWIGAAVEQV